MSKPGLLYLSVLNESSPKCVVKRLSQTSAVLAQNLTFVPDNVDVGHAAQNVSTEP